MDIKITKCISVNFHPSILPKYAGCGGYNRAIINEDREFGCSCYHMTGYLIPAQFS